MVSAFRRGARSVPSLELLKSERVGGELGQKVSHVPGAGRRNRSQGRVEVGFMVLSENDGLDGRVRGRDGGVSDKGDGQAVDLIAHVAQVRQREPAAEAAQTSEAAVFVGAEGGQRAASWCASVHVSGQSVSRLKHLHEKSLRHSTEDDPASVRGGVLRVVIIRRTSPLDGLLPLLVCGILQLLLLLLDDIQ